jgi:hypothetical protein
MGYATEPTSHKAIKTHRCSWCWQLINIGETYKKYRYFMDGDAGTVKAHPECMDAIDECAHEEGGWFEWTPGMERPISTPAKSGEKTL